MQKIVALLTALCFVPSLAPEAFADDMEDLDGDTKPKKKKKAAPSEEEGDEKKKPKREEVVREIERGLYAKANVGTTAYVLAMRGFSNVAALKPGTTLALSVGQDFVDRAGLSMAWEVAFSQSVHNGMRWEDNSYAITHGELPVNGAVQGDTRTFALLANYEISGYPSRRLGIGARVGAGILFAPLIMGKEAYERDVAPAFTFDLAIHKQPHPVFFAGPTIEYYTKLSHFSLGLDIDVGYTIGVDLGFSGTGYMKYSF